MSYTEKKIFFGREKYVLTRKSFLWPRKKIFFGREKYFIPRFFGREKYFILRKTFSRAAKIISYREKDYQLSLAAKNIFFGRDKDFFDLLKDNWL